MNIKTSSFDLLKKTLLLTTLISSVAFAQNYPDKNIKILQGFSQAEMQMLLRVLWELRFQKA